MNGRRYQVWRTDYAADVLYLIPSRRAVTATPVTCHELSRLGVSARG